MTINAPGHRKGHINFLIDGKDLFTGDAIKIKNGKVKPFFKLISSNFELQVESIKKVAQLEGVENIFTAHGGFSLDYDTAIKEWKK